MRYLVLVLLLSACGSPPPAATLHAAPPRVHYTRDDYGRSLIFEQALVNRADSTRTLYAFAYAADNIAQPPARAVYPPRALASMPMDRRFAVGNPRHGVALTLPPGDTVRFRGALPVPTRWPDGQRIPTESFRDFALYLYDEDGRNVFYQTWMLGTDGQAP